MAIRSFPRESQRTAAVQSPVSPTSVGWLPRGTVFDFTLERLSSTPLLFRESPGLTARRSARPAACQSTLATLTRSCARWDTQPSGVCSLTSAAERRSGSGSIDSAGLEIAGLVVSFVAAIWLAKVLVRPSGGTNHGTLDVNAGSGLVTDMRGDPKWGAVGLVVGLFLQLVGGLLRTFDP